MTENQQNFFAILLDRSFGVCSAPTDPQLALQVIADYVLGPDWTVPESETQEQVNTAMVHGILSMVSKQYRADFRAETK